MKRVIYGVGVLLVIFTVQDALGVSGWVACTVVAVGVGLALGVVEWAAQEPKLSRWGLEFEYMWTGEPGDPDRKEDGDGYMAPAELAGHLRRKYGGITEDSLASAVAGVMAEAREIQAEHPGCEVWVREAGPAKQMG